MIDRLILALRDAGAEPDWRELADALWLAQASRAEPETAGPHERAGAGAVSVERDATLAAAEPSGSPAAVPGDEEARPKAAAETPVTLVDGEGSTRRAGASGTPLQLREPSGAALPGMHELRRALLPFKQRRRSRAEPVFDVDATIEHFCETGLLAPLASSARVRWFDEVAIVVDEAPTMVVWDAVADALSTLLQQQGTFKRVTRWTLVSSTGGVRVVAAGGASEPVDVLLDPGGRRVTLVLTDCVDDRWRDGAIWEALQEWGRFGPAALVQMLPPRLWGATALAGRLVELSGRRAGAPSHQLDVHMPWWWDDQAAIADAIPVVTLDGRHLGAWAAMTMGRTGARTPGALLSGVEDERPAEGARAAAEISAEERVRAFRAAVSSEAMRLATLLSAVRVTLPAARLVLARMIDRPSPTVLAEVLAGGLLELDPVDSDAPAYRFRPHVREVLQGSLSASDTLGVWGVIAPHLEQESGSRAPFSFLLGARPGEEHEASPGNAATVEIAEQLIARLGLRRARPKKTAPTDKQTSADVFTSMEPQAFEELCRQIVRRYEGPELQRRPVGESIDLVADRGDGTTALFEFKHLQRPAGRSLVRRSVHDFLDAKAEPRPSRFVLCVSSGLTADARDEVEAARRAMSERRQSVELEVWDGPELLERFRRLGVEDDGPGWDDHAIVLGSSHGGALAVSPEGDHPTRLFTEWLADPLGGGLPHEQIDLLPDATVHAVSSLFRTTLTPRRRRGRLYIYAAGVGARVSEGLSLVVQDLTGDHALLSLESMIANAALDGAFEQVMIILDLQLIPAGELPVVRVPLPTSLPEPPEAAKMLLGMAVPGDGGTGAFTRTVVDVLRGGPSSASELRRAVIERIELSGRPSQQPISWMVDVDDWSFGRLRPASSSPSIEDVDELARDGTLTSAIDAAMLGRWVDVTPLAFDAELMEPPRVASWDEVDLVVPTAAVGDGTSVRVTSRGRAQLATVVAQEDQVRLRGAFPMPWGIARRKDDRLDLKFSVELEVTAVLRVGRGNALRVDVASVRILPIEQVRAALRGDYEAKLIDQLSAMVFGTALSAYIPDEAVVSTVDDTVVGGLEIGGSCELEELLVGANGEEHECRLRARVLADVEWFVNQPTPFEAERFASLAENVESGAPFLHGYESRAPLVIEFIARWSAERSWSDITISGVELDEEQMRRRGERVSAGDELFDDVAYEEQAMAEAAPEPPLDAGQDDESPADEEPA